MVHTARGSYINHRFCFSLLSLHCQEIRFMHGFLHGYKLQHPKRYQSTKGFIRVDIRQRNIINTVPTRKIRIHSRLFCLRTQCSQMFRLQFIYIHKRNQRNHSQEAKNSGSKCCFYCQTSLLNFSPKRGAERYFYRRNFSNMFFCICPKIFPTLLGE